jgi:hypothetical protein
MLKCIMLLAMIGGITAESSERSSPDAWTVSAVVGTWLFGILTLYVTLQIWWHTRKLRRKKNAKPPRPVYGRFRMLNALRLNTAPVNPSDPFSQPDRSVLHVTFLSDDPTSKIRLENLRLLDPVSEQKKKLGEIGHTIIPVNRVLKGRFQHSPGSNIKVFVVYKSETVPNEIEVFCCALTFSTKVTSYPVTVDGIRDSDGMNPFIAGIGGEWFHGSNQIDPLATVQNRGDGTVITHMLYQFKSTKVFSSFYRN